MRPETELLKDTAEDLFEEAPCGYLSTRLDGTIIQVNRTFEAWTGRSRLDLLAGMRFQDLLSPGGRIYHETHYAPLLRMQGSVRGIAVEILRADGSALPALINSMLRRDEDGRGRVIRTTIFDATDRRRYEQELLRASQREHEIAQQLQRSLLAGELPASPALELEIFYSPAVRGLAVGGDWYDSFWIESDTTVGLVVGDVVGRGIPAAATMGQLRSAVRALASTGLGPAAMLNALDEYSRRHGVGEMTTLVYAELALETGVFRFACAGHPPPLIFEPGREPDYAWGGRSTPLNPHGDSGGRSESCCSLRSGAVVLLYTDGLIERRSSPQPDGESRLREELAAHRNEPLKEIAQGIVRALRDPSHSDDVCLLAAQFHRA
ncbi:MAG: SpoIIE family protein phosphatase [Actinomycetota bacterium]|nr:SpoIIE family protein phosphatase [Actinomycetota bacterium]